MAKYASGMVERPNFASKRIQMHFLSEDLEHYVEQHTRGAGALLEQLERATWQKVINPRMLSGQLQGRYLSMLSQLMRPRYIVEIGTYTGYSALCLLEGLQEGGRLITIDINDELHAIHAEYLLRHERSHQIERLFGNALDLIPTLSPQIDMAFIDADKSNYLAYYELLMPLMRSGGLILIDNVLWSGKVVEPIKEGDVDTSILVALNNRIQMDERVDNVLLPLRDGLMLARKR
jgi:caffeoyl-CoA O-methyltransferase